MARNEEKHAGRLNRLWLQQLDEERLKKNPLRPGLGSLRTADEVKKWIPSIKNDIDFYLKQSQVGCYPERKISEFTSMIESLTKEYKAYLRKYRELEGNREEVPWSDKPYTRKHKLPPVSETSKNTKESDEEEDTIPVKKFTPLSVPILENEESYKDLYDYEIMNNAAVSLNSTETIDVTTEHILLPNNEFDDKPLELNRIKIDNYRFLKGKRESEAPSVSLNESCGRSCCSCEQTLSLVTASCECCGNSRKELSHNMQTDIMNEHCEVNDKNHVGNLSYHNILNLPYSDSSGDEEEG